LDHQTKEPLMDLAYGSEYEAFRQEVRAFLEESWPPGGPETGLSQQEQVARFREQATVRGYLYRGIPKRFGGSEQPADSLGAQVIQEEFFRVRAPREVSGNGLSMFVPTLLERGEEWQKEKFIQPVITGEHRWAQGYSEPGAGSDLASLRTRGELVGDEWVVNGQKIWTSDAVDCHYMFTLVRTEPDAPKHAGISYLLIPLDQPGIEIRPLKMITGESHFNEVFLNDARTPADWIVGNRGEGWKVSRTTLKHERNSIGNHSQVTFDSLVRLARRARIDGRPALEDPAIRERMAALEAWVWAQRYSGYFQTTCSIKGGDPGLLPLMNKLMATETGHEIAKVAIEMIGNASLLEPFGEQGDARGNERWMKQFMGSLGLSMGGGTSNIHRNIIAERGLGLPREEAADRSTSK
jgi:alkylation response protein AidB-like acyl-CoA dehydrogenase